MRPSPGTRPRRARRRHRRSTRRNPVRRRAVAPSSRPRTQPHPQCRQDPPYQGSAIRQPRQRHPRPTRHAPRRPKSSRRRLPNHRRRAQRPLTNRRSHLLRLGQSHDRPPLPEGVARPGPASRRRERRTPLREPRTRGAPPAARRLGPTGLQWPIQDRSSSIRRTTPCRRPDREAACRAANRWS